jgi:hypothetical protein
MAKLLTKYMPSSNAEETQPPMNATTVRIKQRLMFFIIVGITVVAEFGPSSASYVIMETITSSDIWILMERIGTMNLTSPPTLPPMSRLLGSFCSICHLRLHLDLQRIDTLPV